MEKYKQINKNPDAKPEKVRVIFSRRLANYLVDKGKFNYLFRMEPNKTEPEKLVWFFRDVNREISQLIDEYKIANKRQSE